MSYSVKILPKAENDLASIYYYIAKRSVEGPERWLDAFEEGVRRLELNPLLHVLAKEDDHFDFELRRFLFKPPHGRTYRAVYRVDGREITILRACACGPGQAPLAPSEVLPR